MKLGAVYPQREVSSRPQSVGTFAQAIEQMGFDHILLYDHVVGAVHEGREPPLTGPYTEKDPFLDPFTAFAYLSTLTSRIEFVTGVLILPQRQTVLVARQAADVDLLSGGRLRLGVGTGWNYVEYEALGEDFHRRGRKLDEQIPYLRRLWSEEAISFKGDFHEITRANITLRPGRQIPIYGGGHVEAAYRRAAKLADGFIFVMGLADPLNDWPHLQQLLREEGRSVEDFGAQFMVQKGPVDPLGLSDLADMAVRVRDIGADDFSISTMERGFASEEEHIDFLADAKAKIEAALR